MGNLQEKLKANKIPNKDVKEFWESFVQKFLELFNKEDSGRKLSKFTKEQLKLATKRLLLVDETAKYFTLDLTPAEDKIESDSPLLLTILKNSDDKVGVALEALEYALKSGAKLNGIIFKYGGFAYLEQIQFLCHRILPKVGGNLQLLDFSNNPNVGENIKWVSTLTEGLKNNALSTLIKLKLNNTSMVDEGVQVLMTFVSVSKLRTFHLNSNLLTEKGCDEIVKIMKQNPRLSDVQLKVNSKISRDSLSQFKKIWQRNEGVAEVLDLIIRGVAPPNKSGSMRGGSVKQRQFSVKMRNFHNSMRQRTKSDADSKVVPVFKWFAEEKSSSELQIKHTSKRFKVASSETMGKRSTMEDVTVVRGPFREGKFDEYFGMFDGHGGKDCAEYAARYLHGHLSAFLDKTEDPIKALTDSFVTVHNEMSGWARYSGTTACVALFIDTKMYIANVGDTRAVVSRRGSAQRLSLDHNVKVVDEVKRIESIGGKITNDRVQGAIAVTRSMGDQMLQPYLIAEPYVSITELTGNEDFLIIACDGVWDVTTDQEAVDIVSGFKDDFGAAAVKLRDHALNKGSEDNISVLIIGLQGN